MNVGIYEVVKEWVAAEWDQVEDAELETKGARSLLSE